MQYASENVIKIGGDFGPNFWKKAWVIVQGIFQELVYFLKWPYLEKSNSESAQTFYIV